MTGLVGPLRYRSDDPPGRETAIFGPLAAWYVGDILRTRPLPPGSRLASCGQRRRLAVKTGTSYGFRDFWGDRLRCAGDDRGVGRAARRQPRCRGIADAPPPRRYCFKIADLLGPAPGLSAPQPPAECAAAEPPRFADAPAAPRIRAVRQRPCQRLPAPLRSSTRRMAPSFAWDGAAVPLEAAGGHGALRWLVDGRPLAPAATRRAPLLASRTGSVLRS